eukprot:553838_1
MENSHGAKLCKYSSRICWSCNKVGDDSNILKQCSQCKLFMYCNAKCQSKHWKRNHKSKCKSFKMIQVEQPQKYITIKSYYQFIESIVHFVNHKSTTFRSQFPYVTIITDLYLPHEIVPIHMETVTFPTCNPWIISESNDIYALVGIIPPPLPKEQWEEEVCCSPPMTYEEYQKRKRISREKYGQIIDNLFIDANPIFNMFSDGIFTNCERAYWTKMNVNHSNMTIEFKQKINPIQICNHQIPNSDLSGRFNNIEINDRNVIFVANSGIIQYFEPPTYAKSKILNKPPYSMTRFIKVWRQKTDIFVFCNERSPYVCVLNKIRKIENKNEYEMIHVLSINQKK